MATHATVPVTVHPDARARIAELGLEREFQQMVEHALRSVAGLCDLRVELVQKEEELDDPTIVLWATKPLPVVPGPDPTEADWIDWQIAAFPPESMMHFVMICAYEVANGG